MNERDMSLLKAMSEAVKEQLSAVQEKYLSAIRERSDEISRLKALIEEIKLSVPDTDAIVKTVLGKITIPAAPELPDIGMMVKEAVAEVPVPVAPEAPQLPDIGAMVQKAVSEIELPQPEPLPDISKMVTEAVKAIPAPEMPEPVELPDINKMVLDAVASIELPKPEALPDFAQMVKDAVAEMPIPEAPEPPELPDIEAMVRKAVDAIELPQPETLPDIQQMVKDAVAEMPSGVDGRDGLQIEILPIIEPEKSYPRGTYALHLGGLWRSHQKTTGMNGWECVMDGINDISIAQNEDRHFTVAVTKSSGEKSEKTFSVPVMIYRDIFKEGEKYYPGDNVTWGGSVWYCHEETGDKPGEDGSKGWKLAVKRGRDARSK